MEERKWEELDMDCLVNVFSRLGMDSMVLDVPFVCKSWYKASLSPLCWQCLVFPADLDHLMPRLKDEYRLERFNSTGFIKSVVNRSEGSAVVVKLPLCCSKEALIYVADHCPDLKTLVLPSILCGWEASFIVPSLISKWKNLEGLRFGLGSMYDIIEILTQVSLHCVNFEALCMTSACIGSVEASAIVALLPNIKYLGLMRAKMERENLVMILLGCKQLVHFDVRNCIGFEGDDEIMKLASHIHTFRYEGSRSKDQFYCEEFGDWHCSFRSDGFR